MINLGDINFNLGADTRGLQNAVGALQQFGNVVAGHQAMVQMTSRQTANALRKQEQAAVNALLQVQRLNTGFRAMQGTDAFVNSTASAFQRLQTELTSGALSTMRFQRAMEQFKTEIASTQRSFKEFSNTTKGMGGDSANIVSSLQNIASASLLISGPLSGIATRITSITTVVKRGGVAMAAFIAGFATGTIIMQKFGSVILDAGVQMKAFQSQFQAVTGSAVQGTNNIYRSIEIARKAGQEIANIAPAFAKFQAAAAGTSIEGKETVRTFEAVAATASKLYLSAEQTGGIFRALEQMMSKGNVQAEELRGQLGDRLPGAFQIAARAMGVTTGKLGELMKKGLVPTATFLPKFIRELERTFNIDGKPIDNYTAAVNNSKTAWFQLRAELDQQIGISDKVMQTYKLMTTVLDTIRVNIDLVKASAVVLLGALVGLAAPAIIAGFTSLSLWIGRTSIAMLGLNTAMMANPILGITTLLLRLVTVVGSVAAAFLLLDTDTRTLIGSMGSLQSWSTIIWNELNKSYTPGSSWISALGSDIRKSWEGIKKMILDTADAARETGPTLGDAINKFTNFFDKANRIVKTWREGGTGVEEIWNAPPVDYAGKFLDPISEGYKRIATEVKALDALKDMGSFLSDGYVGNGPAGEVKKMPPLVAGGEGGGATDKELNKLKRKAEAIRDINNAIRDTSSEIFALQATPRVYNEIMEALSREQEIEQYAEAMRKAGVETSVMAEKTALLREKLELRDVLQKNKEALDTMRDAWGSAFDGIANSLIDSILAGENVFKSLAETGKQVAADLLKTFLQLSLMNPLKNLLFGMDLPVLGGLFKNLGGSLGKVSAPMAGLRKVSAPMAAPMMSQLSPVGGQAGMAPLYAPQTSRRGGGSTQGFGAQSLQVELLLSPDLEARVLTKADSNAVKVSQSTIKAYSGSKVAEAHTQKAINNLRKSGKI